MSKRPRPPRRARNAAERAGLGLPVRRFDPRPQAYAWVGLLGLAGAALVVAGLAYHASGERTYGWVALGLSVVYLGAALWILWRAALRGRVTYLMEGGVVRTCPVETYAFDDLLAVTMAGVRRGRRGRTGWRFTLIAADGRETELGRELPAVFELGEAVVSEVTRRVLPWYVRAVKVGGAVSFGPYVVNREGVGKEGETVPWARVSGVTIANGMVSVHDAGGPGLIATVGTVPNAVAFTALCEQVRAWREPAGR